jgi:dihydrofolate reductase
MSKVFFSVTMSLDGFTAPESRYDDVGDARWGRQWGQLQDFVFHQKFFRENLKLGPGGETGEDNRILEQTFARTGASILGKRMFDAGERGWPEDAPFHTPVFVLTRQVRAPWPRAGGTTFHFVNDGIQSALRQAREAAGDRDVRIGGGAHTIREYLNAGLIDEFHIALAPMLMGGGSALFDRIDADKVRITLQRAVPSPRVTHLFYEVQRP